MHLKALHKPKKTNHTQKFTGKNLVRLKGSPSHCQTTRSCTEKLKKEKKNTRRRHGIEINITPIDFEQS